MRKKQTMEEEHKKLAVAEEVEDQSRRQHQPPNISPMEATTKGGYGGGMYGTEEGQAEEKPRKAPASDTQSAEGPAEPEVRPKHKPPPTTGDRDVDITGQSYIQ